jgi:TM2 domain-containing membrane protein YozV/Tfp pilus assembly protein PilE
MSEAVVQAKFCTSCGKQLHILAEICPGCGVRAMAPPGGIKKAPLLLLTFFLGSFGAHKYYQKQYAVGILYFLFFWTSIPRLVSLIEFIIYCTKSEEELQRLYPENNDVALVLGATLPLLIIPIIGILAAIAIPQFAASREKAHHVAVIADLKSCQTKAEAFYTENRSYPTQTGQLTCGATEGVAVYYLSLGADDFQIVSFHQEGETAYLTGKACSGASENTRPEIEAQLADQFGVKGGHGGFHFIE